MEIVTTHKNTDFDALASVIAATLLYPKAVPVLPKNINPNVKAFLSIHKKIFNVLDSDEFDPETVKRLLVVDVNRWDRLEGMKKLKSNVKVTTIMPYYINTGMFDGVKSRIPILKPEHAAQKIVNAIKKDKKMLTIPGYLYHLTRFNQGLFPLTVFDWIANSIFGIYKTMDHFTGRKN